jgi:hypothetical protein
VLTARVRRSTAVEARERRSHIAHAPAPLVSHRRSPACVGTSAPGLWSRARHGACDASTRVRLSHSATGERVDPRYGLIAIGVEEEGRP